MSFCCLSAASCAVYLVAIWLENRKRDRNATVMHPDAVAQTAEDDEALGDLAPNYRYTY